MTFFTLVHATQDVGRNWETQVIVPHPCSTPRFASNLSTPHSLELRWLRLHHQRHLRHAGRWICAQRTVRFGWRVQTLAAVSVSLSLRPRYLSHAVHHGTRHASDIEMRTRTTYVSCDRVTGERSPISYLPKCMFCQVFWLDNKILNPSYCNSNRHPVTSQLTMSRSLGAVPGPPIFGAVVDSVCLVSQTTSKDEGESL